MGKSAARPMTPATGADTVGAMTENTTRFTVAALGAATACLVLTVVHLTHGPFDDELTSAVDYLNDGAFASALILGALTLVGLQRTLAAPRAAVALAATGQLLVATGVVAGLLSGRSPDWFAAVGVPGNLIWFGAMIALAAWAWRSKTLTRTAAVAIALCVPVGVGIGEFGGALVPCLLWLYLGLRVLPATPRHMPQAATA
jgi:hypothetical protein